jgi:uncharacterized membrane protein YbhN (UPF0104 family)
MKVLFDIVRVARKSAAGAGGAKAAAGHGSVPSEGTSTDGADAAELAQGLPPNAAAGEVASPKARPKSRISSALRWLVAVVLLVAAGKLILDNPEPLRRAAALPLSLLLVMVPLAVLNQVFISWRMSLCLVHAGGPVISRRTWFRLVILGQFLNIFVPQLGSAYRGVALKQEFAVPYTLYASSLISFVWLDTLFGSVLCLVALAALAPGLAFGGVPALPIVLGVVLALASGPFALQKLLGKPRDSLGLLARIHGVASKLVAALTGALSAPSFLARYLCVSILVTAEQIALLWLCFRAVGFELELAAAAVFQVFIKLSNQIVVTPGNLGVMEFAFGLLGASGGGRLEFGIAASLVFRALFTSTVIVLGTILGGTRLLRTARREKPRR